MKQKLLLWMVTVLFAMPVNAGNVTREQARQKAQAFLREQGVEGQVISAESSAARTRLASSGEDPCYYVFNAGQHEGFVIVAGDDMVPEVLGYSTSGELDMDNMPLGMQMLLDGLEEQIRFMRANHISSMKPMAKGAVSPLVKTGWAQLSPYNQQMPQYTTSERCATGCVATAMAQAMSVFRYPDATKAKIDGYSYTQPSTGKKKSVDPVSSGSKIDWGNILNTYTGSENSNAKNAIAKLMLYCGTAIGSLFDNETQAAMSKVAPALKNIFGYSSTVSYKDKKQDKFSDAQWNDLVYNELAAGRPVILAGKIADSRTAPGHAFICDGYDGNGRFHINWGWANKSDAYFLLNMLQPSSVGTGGSSGNFKYEQEAIVGITHDGSTPSTTVYLTVTNFTLANTVRTFEAVTKNDVLSYGPLDFKMDYTNKSGVACSFDLNIGVWKDGTFQEYFYNDNQYRVLPEIPNNSSGDWSTVSNTYKPGNSSIKCFSEKGTYTLKPVSRKHGTSTWYLCDGADQHFITGVVSSSNTLTLTVTGETTPVNPGGGVTAQERELMGLAIENQRTNVEALKATVRDYQDAMYTKQSLLDELRTRYQTLKQRMAILADRATLYDLAQYASVISSDITAFDTYVGKYPDEAEAIVSKGLNACNTYLRDLEQLSSKLSEMEVLFAKMSTKADYDQLTALLGENDAKIVTLDGIASIVLDVNNAETKLSAYKQTLESLEKLYDQLKEALMKEIDKKDDVEKRNLTMQECAQQLAQIETRLSELLEGADMAKDNLAKLNHVLLRQQTVLESLDKKMMELTEKLNASGLSEELQKPLTEIYGMLVAQRGQLAELLDQLAQWLEANPSVDPNLLTAYAGQLNQLKAELLEAATLKELEALSPKVQELYTIVGALAESEIVIYDKLKERLEAQDAWYVDANALGKAIDELSERIDETVKQAEKEKQLLEEKRAAYLATADSLLAELAKIEERIEQSNAKDTYEKLLTFYQKVNETHGLMTEIQELLINTVLTEEQCNAFQERLNELLIPIKDQVTELYSPPYMHLDALTQYIKALQQVLQQAKDELGKATTMDELTAVEELVAQSEAVIYELNPTVDQFIQSLNEIDWDAEISKFDQSYQQLSQLKTEIEDVITAVSPITVGGLRVVSCTDIKGRPAHPRQKGFVILRLSDGSVRKVYNP